MQKRKPVKREGRVILEPGKIDWPFVGRALLRDYEKWKAEQEDQAPEPTP